MSIGFIHLNIFFFLIIILMSILYHLSFIPFLNNHLSEIFAILFIILPWLWDKIKKTEYSPYFGDAFKGIGIGIIITIIILGIYSVLYYFYYKFACLYSLPTLGHNCSQFHGFIFPDKLNLLSISMGHLLGVALPEEYFYRGFLMNALMDKKIFPYYNKKSFTSKLLVILIQAIAFALGHVLVDFNPIRLAVFFPAILFGLLRLYTKGLWAPIILHGFSNVIAMVLEHGFWL